MAFTVKRLAHGVALAIACGAASWAGAQDNKVDVTGTNIKRIEGETGQQLQLISRQ